MDLSRLSLADLTDHIAQLQAIENAIRSRKLEAIVEYDKRKAWKTDGATSMQSWLVGMLGYGRDTAREEVRVAHAFEELTHISANFADGLLSWDQSRATTEFATPETDKHLAEEARKFSATHLRRMARRFKPVAKETADDAIRDRGLDMVWDLEKNLLRFRGKLPGAEGAKFEKAIDRLVQQMADHKSPDGKFDHSKARADALTELASVRIGSDPDPDRATVAVHVDASVLAGGSGMAEIGDGNAIALETARRLSCDSRWYVVIDGPHGGPIGIGRVSRQIPPWLAREVRHRDGGCRFPGCERQGWINIHHIIAWAEGGPTQLDNLCMLCGEHHRLVHECGWRITGDPNGELTFHAPDGRWFVQGPHTLREEYRDRVAALTTTAPNLTVAHFPHEAEPLRSTAGPSP